MSLVPLRVVLDHAAANGYGVAAFNVNNMEQIQAIMEAAHQVDAPVIVQASRGARSYSQDAYLRHLMLAAAAVGTSLRHRRQHQHARPAGRADRAGQAGIAACRGGVERPGPRGDPRHRLEHRRKRLGDRGTAVRAGAHRNGDAEAAFNRLVNLGRTRIVVSD